MNSSVEQALDRARSDEARSVAQLGDLVRIRSLTGEEGPAQAHIEALLRSLGAEVTVAEPDIAGMFGRFPNVAQYPTHWQHDLILPYADLPTYEALQSSGLQSVLNYEGRPNVGWPLSRYRRRSIAAAEHARRYRDGRAAREVDARPFGAEIVDGAMYGRGTSDMKGGVAAALMALTYLGEAGVKLRGDVVFECVVNEEHAGNGTLDLVGRGFSADAAICLEPTSNTIAVSHPGGLYWRCDDSRRAALSRSTLERRAKEGVSAVENLPAVVAALLDLEHRYNVSREVYPGAPALFSLVMGKIAGGHYETVTAGEVVLTGGAYFAPELGDVVAIMQGFRDAIAAANVRESGFARASGSCSNSFTTTTRPCNARTSRLRARWAACSPGAAATARPIRAPSAATHAIS